MTIGNFRRSVAWVCLLELRELIPNSIRCIRTRRGWHMVVEWNRELKLLEIVAIRAILGSDWKRKALNLMRVRSGKAASSPRWNFLFERKLQ